MKSFRTTVFALTQLAMFALAQTPLDMENEIWKLRIEPNEGGRISSMLAKPSGEEHVVSWQEGKGARRAKPSTCFSGGILGGHQCGSYVDEQLEADYEVLKADGQHVQLRWQNPYDLFSGLEETRDFQLDGDTLKVRIHLRNTSTEKRVIYYRVQDFIGLGRLLGQDSVYLYELPEGMQAKLFNDLARRGSQTIPLMNLVSPSYAICNLDKDAGVQVQADDAPLKALMLWIAGANARTVEFFFAPAELAPGAEWQVNIQYRYFQPSKESGSLHADAIQACLVTERAVRCHYQVMQPEFRLAGGALQIFPLHASEVAPTQPDLDQLKTLQSLRLFGTPGETVALAFTVQSSEKLEGQRIQFGEFRSTSGQQLPVDIDPYYVSEGYMVRDFAHVQKLPHEICNVKSQLPALPAITPFALQPGEVITVRSYLDISPSAQPGLYHGLCQVGGQEFAIELQVYPFTLQLPEDKGYGAFFRYMLEGDKHGMAKEWGVSREAFREALLEITRLQWRNLVIYQHNRENILWILDELVALGWRNARFVLIGSDVVTPAELQERYGQYNFSFLPWAVDEPISYNAAKIGQRRYKTYENRGWPRINFSANTPASLALMNLLPKTEPILAVTGNIMYFVETTRRLTQQNRRSFWYAGYPNQHVAGRLVRGVYVWKEPVSGMLDWGADTVSRKPGDDLHGFLGKQLVRTQRLENVRQGTLDLFYLHTLEEQLKKAGANHPAAKEAETFLASLKARFQLDYTGEARLMTHSDLDMIRRQAAEWTTKLLQP
jgi:hypothetical protein